MNNNDVKLDVGAIERILNSDTSHEPVVQVLDIKRIQTSNSGERFRLVISDGKYFIQGMLATQLSNLIKKNSITKHSIVKLDEFVTNAINGRKICVVIKCVPVSNPGVKIGNPISITQKPNNNVMNNNLMNNNINNNSGNQGFRPNNNNNYRNNNTYNNNYNNYNNSGNNNFVNNNNVNYRPISSLNPYQSGWTIKVRCTSKDPMRFYKNQRGDGKVFSVDLIDNQGGEIRASMFNEAATKYYDVFEKNKVYSISKGTVKIARKGYTHIKNDYSIVLNADAEIHELPNDNTISTLNYNFIEINELRHVADKEFVDVIGIITNISELRTILSKKTSKELICRNISLTDKTGTIDCTLWSGDAKNLSENSIGQIIAFKGARISSYGGKSLNPGSSLEYSPNNQQSIDLKVWYQSKNGNINTDNKLTDNTISNKQRRILSEVHEQNIGGNGEIDEKTGKRKAQYFNVLGTVQTISAAADRKPWYLSVHPDEEKNEKEQKFKVTPNGDGTYMCDKNGKSYNKCLPRYILRFCCADFSSNIWLTAFDENGTKILNNVTATQASESLESGNIEEFNKIFKSANFKRFVFTCRAREDMWEDRVKVRFDVQSVQKANFVSESKNLIKKIQDMRSL